MKRVEQSSLERAHNLAWDKSVKPKLLNKSQKRLLGAILITSFALGNLAGYAEGEIASQNLVAQSEINKQEAPILTLEGLITQLKEGRQIKVSNQINALNDNGRTIEVQPIVFNTNNDTYFAYFKYGSPNLDNISSSTAVNLMNILQVGSNAINPLNTEEAHLNKSGSIVDANNNKVAFANYIPDSIY